MCTEQGPSRQQAAAGSYPGHYPSCQVLVPLIFVFWMGEQGGGEVLPLNGRGLEELSAVEMEPRLALMLWEAEAGQDTGPQAQEEMLCQHPMRRATLGHRAVQWPSPPPCCTMQPSGTCGTLKGVLCIPSHFLWFGTEISPKKLLFSIIAAQFSSAKPIALLSHSLQSRFLLGAERGHSLLLQGWV